MIRWITHENNTIAKMIKYNTFANKGRAILRERMIVWLGTMRIVKAK